MAARRVSLPGASELFRPTATEPAPQQRPTGRQRHDSKITVYLASDELVALEQARLTLRADFGIGADRGRIVRQAIATVLMDLQANGGESVLVRMLRDQ